MIIASDFDGVNFYGGDTFDLNLNWKDATGALFNLTGWHARLRFYISKTADRTAPLIEITDTTNPTTAGKITLGTGATSPNIACNIPDEQTGAYDATPPAYYILELEDPSGAWQRLMEGKTIYRKKS
jgi:hypothetical protein